MVGPAPEGRGPNEKGPEMRTKTLAAAAVVASMLGGAGAGIALSIPSTATAQRSSAV